MKEILDLVKAYGDARADVAAYGHATESPEDALADVQRAVAALVAERDELPRILERLRKL